MTSVSLTIILVLSLVVSMGHSSCFLSPFSTRRTPNDEVSTLMLMLDEFKQDDSTSRRSFLTTSLVGLLGASTAGAAPMIAHAGIDPTALKNLPVEGDAAGTATRLRQIEATQKPAADEVDKPWEDLPSGVSFREYREGKGEQGSYALQMKRSRPIVSTRSTPIVSLLTLIISSQLFGLDPRLLWK